MAILTVYVSDEELNEMLKEAHETNCSHKIKDFLIELDANPNSLGISMYDIITMTPNVAWDVYKRELESKKPDIELITNLFDNSILNINDINEENGYTALMWAISYRKKEIYKLLLQRADIDVNVQDEDGWTALMYASDRGSTEIVRMLLEHPEIDKTLKHNNRTAWGMASLSLREQCPDLQPKRKSTTKTNLKKDLLKAIESGKDISEIKKILETT